MPSLAIVISFTYCSGVAWPGTMALLRPSIPIAIAPLRLTCAFSMTTTRPLGSDCCASIAAVQPALPRPTTMMSASVTIWAMGRLFSMSSGSLFRSEQRVGHDNGLREEAQAEKRVGNSLLVVDALRRHWFAAEFAVREGVFERHRVHVDRGREGLGGVASVAVDPRADRADRAQDGRDRIRVSLRILGRREVDLHVLRHAFGVPEDANLAVADLAGEVRVPDRPRIDVLLLERHPRVGRREEDDRDVAIRDARLLDGGCQKEMRVRRA